MIQRKSFLSVDKKVNKCSDVIKQVTTTKLVKSDTVSFKHIFIVKILAHAIRANGCLFTNVNDTNVEIPCSILLVS